MAKALALLAFLAVSTCACDDNPDCAGCVSDWQECEADAGADGGHCLGEYCACLLAEGCDCDYQRACK